MICQLSTDTHMVVHIQWALEYHMYNFKIEDSIVTVASRLLACNRYGKRKITMNRSMLITLFHA